MNRRITASALCCNGPTVWVVMDSFGGPDPLGVFPTLQAARNCVARALRDLTSREARAAARMELSFQEVPMGSILRLWHNG
jgi:hypothetical protein